MSDAERTSTPVIAEDRESELKAELDRLIAHIDQNIASMKRRAPRIAQLRAETRAILDQLEAAH